MVNIFTELNDALEAANRIVAEVADPNNPKNRTDAAAAISKLFQDFNVKVNIADTISEVAADGIETIKGGVNAVSDALADITKAAASKGITINPLETMFLMTFLSTAASVISKGTVPKP